MHNKATYMLALFRFVFSHFCLAQLLQGCGLAEIRQPAQKWEGQVYTNPQLSHFTIHLHTVIQLSRVNQSRCKLSRRCSVLLARQLINQSNYIISINDQLPTKNLTFFMPVPTYLYLLAKHDVSVGKIQCLHITRSLIKLKSCLSNLYVKTRKSQRSFLINYSANQTTLQNSALAEMQRVHGCQATRQPISVQPAKPRPWDYGSVCIWP